jgi:hypothetical protein
MPARKLKVAPQLNPLALVSTLKAISFEDKSLSDWPKLFVLDRIPACLWKIADKDEILRRDPFFLPIFPTSSSPFTSPVFSS